VLTANSAESAAVSTVTVPLSASTVAGAAGALPPPVAGGGTSRLRYTLFNTLSTVKTIV